MKKILTILTIMFASAFIFSGCEDNDIFIPAGETSVFYLNTPTLTVKNAVSTYTFTVTWSKFKKEAGTINIVCSTETGEDEAIEGVDYVLSESSLSFAADEYTKTFTVSFNKDEEALVSKKFEIALVTQVPNSVAGSYGAPGSCAVTIVVHPLAAILGTVTQTWTSYFGGVKVFAGEIIADESNESILHMNLGLVNGVDPYSCKINAEETETEFILNLNLPYDSGWATASGDVEYVGVFYLPEEDDFDVAQDEDTLEGTPFVATAVSPKDDILFKFVNGVPAAHTKGTWSYQALPLPPPMAEYTIVMN